jgi:DNA-binding MarR family transcriptional regulator
MQIEEKSFQTSVFYWIGVLERLANAKFVEDLGGGKALVARWRTLSTLADKDGATINDLADFTFIERSALSRLLEQMEEDGLLERRTRPGDRRTTEVYLTRKGQQSFATMLPVRRAVFAQASVGLARGEIAELMRILHVLIANLQKELQPGSAEEIAGEPATGAARSPTGQQHSKRRRSGRSRKPPAV